jgi:hypothetical protein
MAALSQKADSLLGVFQTYSAYSNLIDNVRKSVAIAMAVCGGVFVLCVHHDEFIREVMRRDSGIWEWGVRVFGTGILACLAATSLLIVEYLSRPTVANSSRLRTLLVRFFLILLAAAAIFLWFLANYGTAYGIGAVCSLFLILAAMRERSVTRVVLGLLAAIVIVLIVSGTQSAYQYAVRHADEIVAAADALSAQVPDSEHGQEINASDPRIPTALRKLGARRIRIDSERVSVYVGGDTEFQISRVSDAGVDFVWGSRGKGATKITERLWTNDY